MTDPTFFALDIRTGVAVATFDRPPVNALSAAAYEELERVIDRIETSDEVRAVVLASPPDARAWIAGADLNDFKSLDYDTRLARYQLVNRCMGRLAGLSRPIIAAINAHAIGAGMTVASLCDIRVASSEAEFAMPEIDRGTTSAGGIHFNRLHLPSGITREMLFTGRRFSAAELTHWGYIDHVVERAAVVPKALEIASLIASKDPEAVRVTKLCCNAVEQLPWADALALTQEHSARLTAGKAAKEGISAFLEGREPSYTKPAS